MNKKIKTIFYKNFTSLSINQFVNILVTVTVTPILFQNLGEINFGLVNLGFSIFMLFSIVICYGYHLNGPKKISLIKKTENEKILISEIISVRIFLTLFISIIILLLSFLTELFIEFKCIILFSIPILLSEAIHPVFYLQGKNNLSTLAILNTISKLVFISLIVIFVNNQNDAFKVNFIFGFSLFIIYLFFWINIFIRKKIIFVWAGTQRIIFRLKENFEFFFSSIAGHASIHSSLIILKLFTDNIELGNFSLANRIAVLLRMIPVFIFQSVLQNAVAINKNNELDLKKYLNYYFSRGLIFTFLIGVFFLFFSKWIIFIFAGKEIDYSVKILNILSFVPFLAMLNFKNIMIILINEKKKILNIATWISALCMLIISFWFSYYYKGIGLAFALLFSELISFIIHTFLLSNNK